MLWKKIIHREKRTVDSKTILNINMAKGGGFVIRLEAEN